MKTAWVAPLLIASSLTHGQTHQNWQSLVEDFIEGYFTAHPDYAAGAGRHEFDGLLPDWSSDGLRTETLRLQAEKEKLTAFPEEALSKLESFERKHLLAIIDSYLFWVTQAKAPFYNLAWYMLFPSKPL